MFTYFLFFINIRQLSFPYSISSYPLFILPDVQLSAVHSCKLLLMIWTGILLSSERSFVFRLPFRSMNISSFVVFNFFLSFDRCFYLQTILIIQTTASTVKCQTPALPDNDTILLPWCISILYCYWFQMYDRGRRWVIVE